MSTLRGGLTMLTESHVLELRSQFPALRRPHKDREAVFLDGPAGTQVPQRVIDAIADYLSRCNANCHGVFPTSVESDELLEDAHQAIADLLGADDPHCVAFGANMTTLTLALARTLSRTWQPGDEILLSGLEHDANYTPWRQAADDAGATVNVIDVNANDCTLSLGDFRSKLTDRTKFVAVGCASNAAGTVNPVADICAAAKQLGALTFLDAVHFAPHALMDVEDFGCDFLACSAYKFFGPHVGILWGKRELLERLRPYKLRPSPDDLPARWMTGTQNHECIMGAKAAVDYLADIGRAITDDETQPRRKAIEVAMQSIRNYEQSLCNKLLDGLAAIPTVTVHGITKPEDRHMRLPTVSVTHASMSSKELAQRLADDGIFAWHGNYYALPLTERIGVEPDGMVRLGLVHYNTSEEVDYLLDRLSEFG